MPVCTSALFNNNGSSSKIILMLIKDAFSQNQTIRNYYQFQAKIYDATRWSFLFGRKKIVDLLSFETPPRHLVEIGCGTGVNLEQLALRFPEARITGIDVSKDMLAKARKKLGAFPNVHLMERSYASELSCWSETPDLILFSYALTMINPQYSSLIQQAQKDLRPGGKIAVVDFHHTKVKWFEQHMKNNHVKMEGHLNPLLESHFKPLYSKTRKAYGGLWNYFLFVGQKKELSYA